MIRWGEFASFITHHPSLWEAGKITSWSGLDFRVTLPCSLQHASHYGYYSSRIMRHASRVTHRLEKQEKGS